MISHQKVMKRQCMVGFEHVGGEICEKEEQKSLSPAL